jgi:hypothetical protein
MYRGLILGGLAFAVVFVAERQFEGFGSDIKRYNTMRAMSGDPPLSQQAIGIIGTFLRSQMKTQRPALNEFVSAIASDLVRYLRISTM